MLDKLKKLYPIEKLFLFFMFMLVLAKTELGNIPEIIIIVIFVIALAGFENKIRHQYDDSNEEYVKRVLEETDEYFKNKNKREEEDENSEST